MHLPAGRNQPADQRKSRSYNRPARSAGRRPRADRRPLRRHRDPRRGRPTRGSRDFRSHRKGPRPAHRAGARRFATAEARRPPRLRPFARHRLGPDPAEVLSGDADSPSGHRPRLLPSRGEGGQAGVLRRGRGVPAAGRLPGWGGHRQPPHAARVRARAGPSRGA